MDDRENSCVMGKGDVLVGTKRRYSLQWEKTFKVMYLVINHSLKSTNFLEEKRKTDPAPGKATLTLPANEQRNQQGNDVPEVSLIDQGQCKVQARC